MKNLRRFTLALCVLFVVTSTAFADPPSRAVRLKYFSGQVSIQPGGVDDWVAATMNRPLTTSDNVWADKDSRAELHLGTAAVRLNEETSVTLANVGDSTVQVQLHQGTLNLRVAHLYDGEIYEIDTPNLAFTVLKSGSYRFDVDATAGTTLVTVWKGEGEATGEGRGVRVHSKEQARFFNGKSLAYGTGPAPNYDGFDDWCRVRDDREDHAYSVRYVPRGVIGYEDLDDYGHWVVVRPYGSIWVPTTVVVDWAPYRYGHWIWVEPWGWTWVDDAPWGFAPFHYGRWVHYGAGWGWCPGPLYVRPYYAPALVAWVGGSHWGIGISFGIGGGVGWFPLGWGEPYIPYYRHSRGYFRSVNITNTRITNITYITNNYYNNSTNIRNIKYVNRDIDGAVTAVSRDTFVNSRPIYRDAVHVSPRQVDRDSVMAGPDMRPSRRSVLGAHADDRTVGPDRDVASRAVVSRIPPPKAERRTTLADEDVRPGPGMRGNDRRDRADAAGPVEVRRDANAPRRPDGRNADADARGKPAEDAASRLPASVPRPPRRGVNDGDETANRAIRRDVPRPPSRNAETNNASGRVAAPGSRRTEDARQDAASADRRVPRPPERGASVADVRNAPAARPPRTVDDSGAARERNEAVPRPPSGMRKTDSEAPSRPVAANVPRPTGEVRREPAPAREPRPSSGVERERSPQWQRPSPQASPERTSRATPPAEMRRGPTPERQAGRPGPQGRASGRSSGERRPAPPASGQSKKTGQ